MVKVLYILLMLIFAAVIVVGFFQPWVHTESMRMGKISQIIVGQQAVFGRNISAYDVPVLANGPDSRLIISIIKIFKPQITDADKKSYLIWGVPVLALLLLLLSLIFAGNRWVNLAIGIIGVVIFAVGAYKINAINLNKLALPVRIGSGLWMSLWGYLGMGLSSLGNLFYLLMRVKKPK